MTVISVKADLLGLVARYSAVLKCYIYIYILYTCGCFHLNTSNLQRFSDICNIEVLVAMKPDPLDAAVVSHRMDDRSFQQRSHHSRDAENSPSDKSSSGSPRNSDVIFETWEMVGVF